MMGLRHNEYLTAAYLLRLLAFVLILVAVVDKNRGHGSPRKGNGSSART